MLKPVLRRGRILLCGTCMEARGIQDAEIAEGKRRSHLDANRGGKSRPGSTSVEGYV
jgi:hypothetical protein